VQRDEKKGAKIGSEKAPWNKGGAVAWRNGSQKRHQKVLFQERSCVVY